MLSITPCRTHISDRFPVASFVVKVPGERCFEVACATDPQLFRPEYRGRRTSENFFTTRGRGLLRAPAGETTVILPPQQLRRFAGSSRVYYALGSYGGQAGEDPRFSISPTTPAEVPFVHLDPGFTGRHLDRTRLGGMRQDAYGKREADLGWGGDALQTPPAPQPTAPAPPAAPRQPYDDGHNPALWADDERWGGRGSQAYGAADSYGFVVDPRTLVPPRSKRAAPPPRRAPPPPQRSSLHPDEYGAQPSTPDATYLDASYPVDLTPPTGWGQPPIRQSQKSSQIERSVRERHEHTIERAIHRDTRHAMAGWGALEPHSPAHRGHPDDYSLPAHQPPVRSSHTPPPRSSRTEHPDYGEPSPPATSSGLWVDGEPEGVEDPRALSQPRAATLSVEEPAGFEDAPALRQSGYGGMPASLSEPEGFEDARALRSGGAYGGRADTVPSQATHDEPEGFEDASALHSAQATGRYGGHSAPSAKAAALEAKDMARIIRPVLRLDGGMESYSRVDADQRGLVWGIGRFNQSDGSLRDVIDAANRRDQAWYGGRSQMERVFGQDGATALRQYIRRDASGWMQPVDTEDLHSNRWVSAFARAGRLHRAEEIAPGRDPFKVAQNEVAIRRHLVPALPLARELGFNSDRSLAMLYDRVVDMGQSRAGQWFRETLHGTSPDGSLSQRLDRVVAVAQTQGRPWSERLRTLRDNRTELNDTTYNLDT